MRFDSIKEHTFLRALHRARLPILTVALTYLLSFVVGAVMVHAGNKFALDRRDALVGHGETHDAATIAFQEGRRFTAFSIEWGRDCLRATIRILEGIFVVPPYPLAAYTGWYHGITSVDSNHESQFGDPFGAVYYFFFQLLTLISISLSSGAGVNLTLACLRQRPWYQSDRWHGVPKEALRDLLRIYCLVVALIFLASAWEYLFP